MDWVFRVKLLEKARIYTNQEWSKLIENGEGERPKKGEELCILRVEYFMKEARGA